MSRRPAPVPSINPVPRDLTVEDVRDIVAMAERAQAQRAELVSEVKAALEADEAASE